MSFIFFFFEFYNNYINVYILCGAHKINNEKRTTTTKKKEKIEKRANNLCALQIKINEYGDEDDCDDGNNDNSGSVYDDTETKENSEPNRN